MMRWVSLVWPAVLSAFAIAVAAGTYGSGVVWTVSVLTACVFGALFLGALAGLPSLIRDASLRRALPTSLLIPSAASDEFAAAVARLSRWEDGAIEPPLLSMTVAIDEHGLTFWSGLFHRREFYSVPWGRVARVGEHTFRKLAWRGLAVEVHAGFELVSLAFPVFGAGPGGGFAVSARRVRELVESIPYPVEGGNGQ